jgi:hypothetical protein
MHSTPVSISVRLIISGWAVDDKDLPAAVDNRHRPSHLKRKGPQLQ